MEQNNTFTVREIIKKLIDFNPDAKLAVVHNGSPIAIDDISWAVSGGDSSGERDIQKEKANAYYVYLDCDKPENA